MKKWIGQLSNTPLENGHLMHVDPKLHIKCPPHDVHKVVST